MDTKTKADELRNEARQHDTDAAESFERCDTDGFVSQWASGIMARVKRLQADIEEHGGFARFERTVLVYADTGELVADARRVETRYGRKWRVDSADKWMPYNPARATTLGKHGFAERTIAVKAPAKADTYGGGRGLAGAASVGVTAFRTDDLPGGGRERNEWRFAGFDFDELGA